MSTVYLTPKPTASRFKLPACPPPPRPRASCASIDSQKILFPEFPTFRCSKGVDHYVNGFFLTRPGATSNSRVTSSITPLPFVLKPRPSNHRASNRSSSEGVTLLSSTQNASIQPPSSGKIRPISPIGNHSIQISSSGNPRPGSSTRNASIRPQSSEIPRLQSLTTNESFQISSSKKPRLTSSTKSSSFRISSSEMPQPYPLTWNTSFQLSSSEKPRLRTR